MKGKRFFLNNHFQESSVAVRNTLFFRVLGVDLLVSAEVLYFYSSNICAKV